MKCIAFVAALAAASASGPVNDWATSRKPAWTRIEGSAEFRGTSARFEWLFAPTGFRRTIRGPVGEVTVFDGERVWRSENGGPAFELECFARERILLEATVWSGSWREHALSTDDEGPTKRELRLPGGSITAELLVGLEPRDPERLVVPANGAGHRFEFDGWADRAGGRWPARVTERSPAGLEQSFEFEDAASLDEEPTDALTRPATASPAIFDPDAPDAVDVRASSTGHLFVRPTVNGEDVGWFLFDSGAGATLLSPEVSERLGLEPFGEERLTPFGPKAFEARLRRVASLRLGPLEIRDLVAIDRVGPDMASRLLGEPVAGVLGWDVFLRSIVTIDPREPAIAISNPATFEHPSADWQPLSLHWKVPYVQARFEGDREGLFLLDTGAGNASVIFHAAAVERLALLDGRETVEASGGGPGGDVAMRIGELEWFELAGTRRTAVPAVFSVGADGEDDPYTLGFLGAGILGTVDVVYDYGRRRIAFVPDDTR